MEVLTSETVTRWLVKWSEGDSAALEEVTAHVYRDLRRLAGSYLRNERQESTLQPTALVHEAWLRIRNLQHVDWKNRSQFIGVVAQVMRHVLVDDARERLARKRGGDVVKVPLGFEEPVGTTGQPDLLELNDALDKLGAESPRKARVVELFYFGGLTAGEIVEVLSAEESRISQRSVENDLRVARARLRQLMS